MLCVEEIPLRAEVVAGECEGYYEGEDEGGGGSWKEHVI